MAKKKMLTPDMTVAEALALVKNNDVPMEAYEEWDAARMKKLGARSTTSADEQISKADFLKDAKSVTMVVDGTSYTLEPKEFSTGSLGWGYHGKLGIKVGDKTVKVQGSVNLTVIGSKNKK
jgi:hypothetical protein